MRGKNYNTFNWTNARFAGTASCGHRLMKGDAITFRPMDRRTECCTCSHKRAQAIRDARAAADKREPMIPGLIPGTSP